VTTALERTDWLNELRDLGSNGIITLRVAGEYPPERAADAQRHGGRRPARPRRPRLSERPDWAN
jgi:hypothetical protein